MASSSERRSNEGLPRSRRAVNQPRPRPPRSVLGLRAGPRVRRELAMFQPSLVEQPRVGEDDRDEVVLAEPDVARVVLPAAEARAARVRIVLAGAIRVVPPVVEQVIE